MSFAARLKEKRMRGGLSLQGLADAIGVSKAHLWDLETGKSKNPSADLLKKLSDYFKVSVAWWFGEEVGEDDKLRVMFRQLQELDTQTLAFVQAIIDKHKSLKEENKDDSDRQDGSG